MSEKLWQNDKTTNLEPVRTANRNGRLLLNVAQRETIKREKKKDKLLERRCPTHTQSAEACKKKKKRFWIILKPGRKAAKNFQDTGVLTMDLRDL